MKYFLALALVAPLLTQQGPPAPDSPATTAATTAIAAATDPAQCVAALRTFIGKRQQEVRPPTGYTTEVLKKVEDEKTALGAACVARFQSSSDPAALPGLAELYAEVGQADRARTTIAAALDAKMPASARAATLVAAVGLGLREPKSEARNARLEKIVDELDALNEAALEQKWTAHSRLESYYRGDDIDAGILKHARWMAQTAKSFTPEQRKRFGSSLVQSQVNAAEALAGQGMNDEALALLRRTVDESKDIPGTEERVRPAIERYSLVGTPAAPIKAARWLNAPAGTTEMPMTGAVTLLEFTAHWCGPCRESYPGVNRLRQQFGAKGFRVVMATRYYGYFSKDGKTERDLSNDDELKRDEAYFAEHKLDVPVAIGDLVTVKVVDGKVTYSPGLDPNDTAYKVSGIPQIHLIDKRGRIRLIMIGYDDANESKLAEIVAKLLAEDTHPSPGDTMR
jgi:thiol-disulfide isomerase/thioredoxin